MTGGTLVLIWVKGFHIFFLSVCQNKLNAAGVEGEWKQSQGQTEKAMSVRVSDVSPDGLRPIFPIYLIITCLLRPSSLNFTYYFQGRTAMLALLYVFAKLWLAVAGLFLFMALLLSVLVTGVLCLHFPLCIYFSSTCTKALFLITHPSSFPLFFIFYPITNSLALSGVMETWNFARFHFDPSPTPAECGLFFSSSLVTGNKSDWDEAFPYGWHSAVKSAVASEKVERGYCTPGTGGLGDDDQLEFWLSHWKLTFPVWIVELSHQEYSVELKHSVSRRRKKKGLENGTGKSNRTCMTEGEETLIYPQNFKYSDEDKTGLSPAAVSRIVLLLTEAVSLVCCRGRCKQVTRVDSVPSMLFFPWPQTNQCLIWIPSHTLERRRQNGIVFFFFDSLTTTSNYAF